MLLLFRQSRTTNSVFNGTNVSYPYTNTTYGFKAGKHELLPFPDTKMNVNKNIQQNPGW